MGLGVDFFKLDKWVSFTLIGDNMVKCYYVLLNISLHHF